MSRNNTPVSAEIPLFGRLRMLDAKFVRENIEKISTAAKHKNVSFDASLFVELFEKRSKAIEATEILRRQRNEGSDSVKKAASKEEREGLLQKMRLVGEQLTAAENKLREVEAAFDLIQLTVPSIPSADTPIGTNDAENVEWRKEGILPKFDFQTKDHMDLGAKLGLIDF